MLKGKIIKVKELTEKQKVEMFDLMTLHYDNYKLENFKSDLFKKEDIVLELDEKSKIMGFTTIEYVDIDVENKPIKLLFSGDTIIHKDYWANNNLISDWFNFIYKKSLEIKPVDFYWLLFSKGYKTYKYLPLFFKNFYPCYGSPTPVFEQKIIDSYALKYYPDNYNKQTGVIEMNRKKDYLKNFAAEIPNNMLNNKNVQFFLEKNPNFRLGNELVCCAKIDFNNLSRVSKKIIGVKG